jgi:hypothetical protein
MDFYNSNIIARHDEIMVLNAMWVDHFNFMLGLPFNTDAENSMYQDEMAFYLCYDV